MSSLHRPRAVIIGLDGATFDLLEPMAAEGWLPNLQQVMAEGARGRLWSTVPPLTAPAWTSFMTGLGPGGHGIYSFRRALDADLQRQFVNSTDLRVPRLWHWLAQAGLRCGVVNLPMTWPPQPMPAGSYMVSGMLTPSTAYPFTDPPELADELRAMGYVCDLRIKLNERDVRTAAGMTEVAAELRQVLQRRESALFRLLARYPTDVLTVVFETADRLQHWAWRAIEDQLSSDGSLERTRLHEAVQSCYRELDRVVGRLLSEAATPETSVFFLSDHGFGPLHSRFHVDQWLAEGGWLGWESAKARLRQRLREPLQRVKGWIPRAILSRGRRALAVDRLIDWNRTQAYSGYAMEGAIYINLQGREPRGIVDPMQYDGLRRQIRDELLAVRDPLTGMAVVRAAYLREDLYDGPHVDSAPDLLFTLEPGYEPTAELSRQGLFSDAVDEGAGIHQPEGIFMALGPAMRAGITLPDARIEDVLPTLLYALGLPVPTALSGSVVEPLFDPAHLHAHPVVRTAQEPPAVGRLADVSWSAADAAELTDRLSALGYLK